MNKLSAVLLAWLLATAPLHAQVQAPMVPTAGGSGSAAGVSSITTSCAVTGGGTGAVALATNSNPNVQSGANYAILSTDCGSIVYLNNASNQIPTIAQAGSAGFAKGFYVELCNIGAGTQTITPATSTIGGAATYVLAAGTAAAPKCIGLNSDGGTNYALDLTGPNAVPPAGLFTTTGALKGNGSGAVSQAACADLSNGGTACPAATGTSGATLPFLNGTNTWSGTQTFGNVFGSINAQSGTTYTLAATDCGKTVVITNASAITLTTLNSIPAGCAIAVEQGGAGQITVANGSGATLTSAHNYTKTFNAVGAIIGLFVDTSSGTNAHFVLTGDGA